MSANTTPKCTSWLGHKFEARYSSEPGSANVKMGQMQGSEAAVLEYARVIERTLTKRIYECDVCVRCGAIVNRPPIAA